ncbi:hypothetical protein FUAX_04590 [Fulvitalea axinellae]|uniref:Uncharacterized protein n=1 Tax=Fulvitalea axinellae TaxID=1182444 RepID=A0AAU9CMB1_9BACT|nr:hypothetical protein FUAX_04590 [Fulvitalea axinellae]
MKSFGQIILSAGLTLFVGGAANYIWPDVVTLKGVTSPKLHLLWMFVSFSVALLGGAFILAGKKG